MIAPNIWYQSPDVVQSERGLVRLTESFREAAARQLDAALSDVSGKRIGSANVPGVGVTFLSRCTNGDACNPLFRIAGVFVLMKRLGMGRERAQRLVDWLQEIVDWLWPDTDAPAFDETMQKEQELDVADDPCQMRAVYGDTEALAEFIETKRQQRAHDRVVIQVAKRQLATLQGAH